MAVISLLSKAGQRPFFTPQMQQVRPRWQPMHSQQQVRPPGKQRMPGARQAPRARGIRHVLSWGVPGQQESGGAGSPSQRVGGMGQAQVRGPGAICMQQGPRPAFKFQQNVRKPACKKISRGSAHAATRAGRTDHSNTCECNCFNFMNK